MSDKNGNNTFFDYLMIIIAIIVVIALIPVAIWASIHVMRFAVLAVIILAIVFFISPWISGD